MLYGPWEVLYGAGEVLHGPWEVVYCPGEVLYGPWEVLYGPPEAFSPEVGGVIRAPGIRPPEVLYRPRRCYTAPGGYVLGAF